MSHPDNTTFGIGNITGNQTVVNNSYSPDLGMDELFNRTATTFGRDLAGGSQMSGLLMLFIFGAGLYYADADPGEAGRVMVPTALLLGSQGFLPFGTSIVYSTIVGVAAVFAYGIVDYAFG